MKRIKEIRKYGLSENSPVKYEHFYSWFQAAAGIQKMKLPGITLYFVDLTAGPFIDPKGNRNVLARAIDAYAKGGILHRTKFIAFEAERSRADALCDNLHKENLLSNEGPAHGKVCVINKLFSDHPSWIKSELQGARGEVCFDPRPDLHSTNDAKLISDIIPGNMSISAFAGETIMNRMEKGEISFGRDGSSRSMYEYIRVLRGLRTYAFWTNKSGACGGRVCLFTNANTHPKGFRPMGEGNQLEFTA